MPADLLLPLFALTLVANAVLIGVAIRGMRRGSFDGGPRAAGGWPPPRLDDGRASLPTLTELRDPAPSSIGAGAGHAPPHVDGGSSSAAAASTTVGATAPVQPASRATDAGPEPVAAGAPPEPAGAKGPDRPVAESSPVATTSEPKTGRRSRRKFSLPPLDDDHDKVSRSIETFLGGGEDGPTGAVPASGPSTGPGAVTVALVAIEGLPTGRRRTRRSAAAAGDRGQGRAEATIDAVAMVERTLRGAARGSDIVSVDRAGRFRIVLPGTGELAARAYLRRVRASVEPILEASDDPLRLVVATATVLGGPVDDAIRAADRRLAALRRATRAGAADPTTGTTARPDAADIPDEDQFAGPRAAAD